jgi:hypothetical protein
MPLTVFSCCTYSPLRRRRTPEQWAALHFVKAIKGTLVKGYACVPMPGGRGAHLDQRTSAQAANWFGRMAASRITLNRVGRVSVVPVPDAACDISSTRAPRTIRLADALVSSLAPGKATLLDVLRWVKAMPSAHQAGGTRDPQELYGRLRLTAFKLPRDQANVVLVDDVLASGGHLRAAAAFLRDCGAHVIAAVCAGRADDKEADDLEPFRTRTDVLPDFVSDPDWLLPLVVDGVEM